MTAYSIAPVRFSGVSMVTATLGANDPQVGDRCSEGGVDYVFVYNNGTSQISPTYGAVASAVVGYSVTVSSVTDVDFLVGVCVNATLTTGTYGWLGTGGFVKVQMGANNSAAAAGLVGLGTDGTFANAGVTAGTAAVCPTVFGKYMSAVASGGSATAFLSVY